MDNAVLVQILKCTDDLKRVRLHLEFMQSLAPFKQIIQGLILADLKQDVHVFRVFKKVLKLADMLVLKRPMDFNFRHQFLSRSWLIEWGLLHDFAGLDHFGLIVDKLVALSKPAFAEELALLVSSDAVSAIFIFNLFFDCARGSLLAVHLNLI